MMNNSSPPTKKSCNLVVVREYAVLISTLGVAFLVIYCASCHDFGQFLPGLSLSSFNGFNNASSLADEPVHDEYYELRKLLNSASTKEKTVILTYLNEAWAAPNSIFDIFLDSFRIGINTSYLLNHLLVIAVDDNAFSRCKSLVSHCYLLQSNESSAMSHQANFMTPIYMDMMWRRLSFLQTILTLGYNFLMTDTDIVWLRDPFPHLISESSLQTSCDRFNGRQFDLKNTPNVGFVYAKSNNNTIKFYESWVSSRHKYPHLHEQDALNKMKREPTFKEFGLKLRFLDTNYFSGFCAPSRDFNKVCTMHANCCVGLDEKIADLKIVLEDWKSYISANHTKSQPSRWHVPRKCHM